MKNSKKLADAIERMSDRLARIEDTLAEPLTVVSQPALRHSIGRRLVGIGIVVLAVALFPCLAGGALFAFALSVARWPAREPFAAGDFGRWWIVAGGGVLGLAVEALFSVARSTTVAPAMEVVSLALISLGGLATLGFLALAFSGQIDVGLEHVESDTGAKQ